jgi:hypothetical protein
MYMYTDLTYQLNTSRIGKGTISRAYAFAWDNTDTIQISSTPLAIIAQTV